MTRRSQIILLVFVVLSVGSCRRSAQATVKVSATENFRQKQSTASEAGIYSAMLSGFKLGPGLIVGPNETLLLSRTTIKPGRTEFLSSDPSVGRDAIADLTKQNLTTMDLPAPFDAYMHLKLVSTTDASKAGLARVRRANPATTGILHLSRIGYSADQTQAIIYTNFEHWDGSALEQFAVIETQTRERAMNVRWIDIPRAAEPSDRQPATRLADLTPNFLCHHVADIKSMPVQDEPVNDAIYNGIHAFGRKHRSVSDRTNYRHATDG
jgi:hypothetical protein